MKFVIAQMQHETNTFSPVPTPWEEFGPKGPYLGRDAFDAMKGKGMAMAAFMDLAAKIGAEAVTPVAAWANPSGPVDGRAYDRICEAICDDVAKPVVHVELQLDVRVLTQQGRELGQQDGV